jgi:hypothetical protein
MIRLTVKTSTILLLAALATFSQAAPAGAALFNDPNLEAVVRKLVFAKKNNTEPLNAEDVKDISTINGKGQNINDLTGIEQCKSLASLDLADNAIGDLTPLAGLKNLQSLNLSLNLISDVSPLAGLAKLQYLHLADNQRHLGPERTRTALVAVPQAQPGRRHHAFGQAQEPVVARPDRQRRAGHFGPGRPDRIEISLPRSQQGQRADHAGRHGQEGCRGRQAFRPLLAGIPGRQPFE